MNLWDTILGRAKHVFTAALRCQVGRCQSVPVSTCASCGRLMCLPHGYFNVSLEGFCASCASTIRIRIPREARANGNVPPSRRRGPPPHQVLNVPLGASKEDIKTAYRARAKQFHPDGKTPDPAMFRKVQAAYEELMR
jgi:DnaJ-like protein